MNARSKKTALLSFAFIVFLYVVTDPLLKAPRLHINFSNSVPVGLYREASERAGSYAAICLPAETVQQAIHAGLAMEHGTCPGGFEPILKPLFEATETSPIQYNQNGFSVAGRLLPRTAPKSRSRLGTPLAHAPFGIYRSGLWAISAFNSSSFDSRYFGPVTRGSIQFRAKPFLTF
jgi:conjugative transfer signal peptidase TraF